MSKEIKIGLLLLISILVFFAGFYFLKGSNIFNPENEYFAYYEDVEGLQLSSPIQVRGFAVGKVSKIELNGGGKVKVTLAIPRKTKVPVNSIAKLTSLDLLGTKGIELELGNSTVLAEEETVLASDVQGGLVDAISTEVNPLIRDVRQAVAIVDSILLTVNGILNEKARVEFQQSMTALNHTMRNFQSISDKLSARGDELAQTISNANRITGNLANNNEQIERILHNLDATTTSLKNAPIERTVNELRTAAEELKVVMQKINNGEGTIGKAVNDPQLYEELNTTLKNFGVLVDDLQKHPSRYINITVFGRKAKVGN